MPLAGILVDNGPKLDPFLMTTISMVSAEASMFVFTLCWRHIESIIVTTWIGILFYAFLSLPTVIL